MKQDIEIIRGTTNTFAVTVKDKSTGNLYEMAEGEIIRFGVKKKPEHEDYVLLKEFTTMTDGVCEIRIAPDDTASLPFGKYFYDVGLQSGADYFPVIKPSVFHIKANITKKG